MPQSGEVEDTTVDLTQSEEYKLGAALFKSMNSCGEFKDFHSDMMDTGKKLWEVSDNPGFCCASIVCTSDTYFQLSHIKGLRRV